MIAVHLNNFINPGDADYSGGDEGLSSEKWCLSPPVEDLTRFFLKKMKTVSVKFESAAISWRPAAHCRIKVCNRIVKTSIHPLSAQRGRCWTLPAAFRCGVPHWPARPKVIIQRQSTIPTELHTQGQLKRCRFTLTPKVDTGRTCKLLTVTCSCVYVS